MPSREERKAAFISKGKEVHCDENLDYGKVVYINNRTAVTIIDNDLRDDGTPYGEYSVTPSNFLKGQSHPDKRALKISRSKRQDFERLKERFMEVHDGESLDYSKAVYVNMHTPILIIDHDKDSNGEEYGEYLQEPSAHLRGSGHPRKAIDRNTNCQKMTTEQFIKKAKEVHGDRYDYSASLYEGYRIPLEIACPKHGVFLQTPEAHLQGKGCQKCGNHYSRYDEEIACMLEEHGIEVIRHDRDVLDGKEIDVLIPSRKIGIEFHGLKWHSERFGGKDSNYHLDKTLKCAEKGYGLIQVFEDEYVHKKETVMAKIRYVLGLSDGLERVMARKCTVRPIERRQCADFMEKWHIQGFAASTMFYGGFKEDGTMVAAMSFKKRGMEGVYELTRYATDGAYICQGMAGKMVSAFIRENGPSEIVTFADRRWTVSTDANMYDRIGFVKDGYIRPSYWYYNEDEARSRRIHRFGLRKGILSRKYGLPMTMTEREMTESLGYDRIWDCGLIRYVWRKNEK